MYTAYKFTNMHPPYIALRTFGNKDLFTLPYSWQGDSWIEKTSWNWEPQKMSLGMNEKKKIEHEKIIYTRIYFSILSSCFSFSLFCVTSQFVLCIFVFFAVVYLMTTWIFDQINYYLCFFIFLYVFFLHFPHVPLLCFSLFFVILL